MGLPTDILRFFSTPNIILTGFECGPISVQDYAIKKVGEISEAIAAGSLKNDISEIQNKISDDIKSNPKAGAIDPYSIADFLSTRPELDQRQVFAICRSLEHQGHLFKAQTNIARIRPGFHFLLNRSYVTEILNPVLEDYGFYDFLIDGFPAIRKKFTKSVRAVGVKMANGIDSIGTCFDISPNLIMTARHCVENMKIVKIDNYLGGFENAKKIYISTDPTLDVAIIELDKTPTPNQLYFRFQQEAILDDVLTMGYPPIPTFQAIQVADIATVNAYVKSSIGNVVAEGQSYLSSQQYILINARVKGGNSGGPVIKKTGEVIGMLIEMLNNTENNTELDSLGYGVAIPSSTLQKFIADVNGNKETVTHMEFTNSGDGFTTIIN